MHKEIKRRGRISGRMGDYAKLAVFIAVLLLSVSMMSVAIDYLGDISDIELDMEPQDQETEPVASESGETSKGKGKTIQVGGAPGGEIFPLYEIRLPPRTKYLRKIVGETYEDGVWEQYEDQVTALYRGESITPTVTASIFPVPVFFTIMPFFNLSGFIPATLSVVNIGYNGTLEHYPSLELFHASEASSSAYTVSYALYDLEAMLPEAEVLAMEEYTVVPEDLKDRLATLANDITEGHPSAWGKLNAIEAYIEDTYEYAEEYTLPPSGVDPVEWFLFDEKAGTCSLFNSAFVFLARSIGLPARVVMGYNINPEAEYQLVMPQDAHMWVEVPFEELSWITFDATPEKTEESRMDQIPTITNITYNDDLAIKGDRFTVEGTVTTTNGSAVDGLSVEIYLAERKNETGLICGTETVVEGVFRIRCDAVPILDVGDYQLIAHALPGGVYQESWSDPPIRIISETEVSIEAPTSVYVGEDFTILGTLVDKSNGEPITNATVTMVVEDDTLHYTTDETGMVALAWNYDEEGNMTLGISVADSTYYLGSNSSFGIAVSIRPPPQPGLLETLTMFPYNVMLAAGAAISIGAVVVLTRRRRRPIEQAAEVMRLEEEEELPLVFENYKEGVVKLFNRFYALTRRRHSEITESMTPREFQQALAGKIPSSGASALEYLVTSFEIADYSTSRPTKEMYDKCFKAVEILRGMMQDEQ
jgi:transglutaminase-like putative cysteine protease